MSEEIGSSKSIEKSGKMEFNIKLTLYFEIRDSEVYGGMGSIGYSEIGINVEQINYERDNLFNKKELMEEYIFLQTKYMAGFSKVPVECVRLISKNKYESETDGN